MDNLPKGADVIPINKIEQLANDLKEARKAKRAEERATAKANGVEPGLEAIIDADLLKVRDWMRGTGTKYLPRDNTFNYRGSGRPPGFMGRVISRASADPLFTGGDVELACHLFADEERANYVAELRKSVPLAGDGNDAPERFLSFLLQRQTSAVEVAVFTHWIWQIKRRIHGLHTEWEMMPLFTGGQGWGKTRHLQRLWAGIPTLPTFVAKGQRMKIFDDDFGRAIFSQAFIIPFEEMSGAKNVDMENLKMFITETEVTARIMRAEQFRTMKMNASFYGTSNLPGGASLTDDSGMRRFWVFGCPDTKFVEAEHGPQLVALGDLGAVFHSVDAQLEASPIRPHLDKLAAEQNKQFSNHGALHDFFTENKLERTAEEESNHLLLSGVWDEFLLWKVGQNAYDREKLSKSSMLTYLVKQFGDKCYVNQSTGGPKLKLRRIT